MSSARRVTHAVIPFTIHEDKILFLLVQDTDARGLSSATYYSGVVCHPISKQDDSDEIKRCARTLVLAFHARLLLSKKDKYQSIEASDLYHPSTIKAIKTCDKRLRKLWNKLTKMSQLLDDGSIYECVFVPVRYIPAEKCLNTQRLKNVVWISGTKLFTALKDNKHALGGQEIPTFQCTCKQEEEEEEAQEDVKSAPTLEKTRLSSSSSSLSSSRRSSSTISLYLVLSALLHKHTEQFESLLSTHTKQSNSKQEDGEEDGRGDSHSDHDTALHEALPDDGKEQEAMIALPETESKQTEKTEKTEKKQDTAIYKCRKCRCILFHASELVTHIPKNNTGSFIKNYRVYKGSNQNGQQQQHSKNRSTASSKFGRHYTQDAVNIAADAEEESKKTKDTVCSSWFLNVDELSVLGLQMNHAQGVLTCPGCDVRLGAYNYAGLNCSCSSWITPGIQVVKSRVDVTDSTFQTPNPIIHAMTTVPRPAAAVYVRKPYVKTTSTVKKL